MTRFHIACDDSDDENVATEEYTKYHETYAKAPVIPARKTSRYALECSDTDYIDTSLVEYTQYPRASVLEKDEDVPIRCRNAATASVSALRRLSRGRETSLALTLSTNENSYDRDLQHIAQLLRQMPALTPRQPPPPRAPLALPDAAAVSTRALQQQLQQQHEAAQQALRTLLQQTEARAAQIQRAEEELRRAAEVRAEEAAAAARARDVVPEVKTPERVVEIKETSTPPPNKETTPPRSSSRRSKEEGKSPAKATDVWKKYRSQLGDLQRSVADFETAANVKDRRLQYKKLVNGRINTLAENVQKIQQVAQEVAEAITTARAADDASKAANQNDMSSLGKRYLVNLLASKIMVRAQAEGFNGQRGDGFPLAHMLSMVAAKVKDVVPVLLVHLCTLCPTAIPTLPLSNDDDSNEDAFMEQLGMIRDKEGRFESFERFLSRTEGLISLVANIMASEPSDHVLMGGHLGAIKWLKRFLALLPAAPQSPLPLITAPVLDAFLTGAGHMMANVHTEAFRELLQVITTDVCLRLDESAIGMPSATRLRKTVRVGLEGFQKALPSRALPELYYGADKTKSSDHTAFSSLPPPPPDDEPIGSTSNDGRPLCKFYAEGRCRNGDQCNFSHERPTDKKPFGAAAPAPFANAFGSPPSTSPFGSGAPSTFGSAAPAPTPFGSGTPSSFGSTTPATTPFGSGAPSTFGSATPAPTPFGSGGTASFGSGAAAPSPFGPGAATPFGSGAPAPAPFGSGATTPFGSGAPSPASFGSGGTTPFGSGAPAPTPFGSGGITPFGSGAASPAPFGSGTASVSPFGSGVATQAPSPFSFGGNTGQNASPFGSSMSSNALSSSSSPFGGVSTTQNQSSPFAAPTSAPSSGFGSAAFSFGMAPSNAAMSSATPFGAPPQSTFSSNLSPFGSPAPFNSAPTPFGSGTSALFGSSPAPSTFGGSAGTTNPSPFAPSTSNASPFGVANTPSLFGGSNATQTFGGAMNQTSNSLFDNGFSQQQQQGSPFAFGQSAQQTGTPFGSGGQSGNVFGLGQGGNTVGDNRQPCKYYAKGQCKYGANCNFSHGNTSAAFGSTMSNPFGAPRR